MAGAAAGDAIGANVTMLTLVLGLAAMMGQLPVGGRVHRYLVGASILGVAAAVVMPGSIGRAEGLVLVLLYVIAVAAVWIRERQPPAIGELAELGEEGKSVEDRPDSTGLFLVVTGIGVMALGGWVAVLGAERLVDAVGVTDSVIGLSVVALATTAELFALAVSAHRNQVGELAVAGVVGSAGYNATVTLGGAALARPIVTTNSRQTSRVHRVADSARPWIVDAVSRSSAGLSVVQASGGAFPGSGSCTSDRTSTPDGWEASCS